MELFGEFGEFGELFTYFISKVYLNQTLKLPFGSTFIILGLSVIRQKNSLGPTNHLDPPATDHWVRLWVIAKHHPFALRTHWDATQLSPDCPSVPKAIQDWVPIYD